MAGCDKHHSLQQCIINYGYKKFYSIGPQCDCHIWINKSQLISYIKASVIKTDYIGLDIQTDKQTDRNEDRQTGRLIYIHTGRLMMHRQTKRYADR